MPAPIRPDHDLSWTLQGNAGRDAETTIEDLARKVSERLSDLAAAVDAHDLQVDLNVRVLGHRGSATVHGFADLAVYRDLDHYEQIETEPEAETREDA